MKSSHRFPLRRQIVWGMRFLPFLPSGRGRGAVHSLQPICACQLPAGGRVQPAAGGYLHRDQSGSADALLNWASIDSTVRRYISQEKYQRHPDHCRLRSHAGKILFQHPVQPYPPLFVTNENDRHLQFGPLNSSAALNRTSVKQFLTKGVRDAVRHRPAAARQSELHRHQPACPLRQGHLAPGQHLPCAGYRHYHRPGSRLQPDRRQRVVLGDGQPPVADRKRQPDRD